MSCVCVGGATFHLRRTLLLDFVKAEWIFLSSVTHFVNVIILCLLRWRDIERRHMERDGKSIERPRTEGI